jgi:hypothetical protein
MPHVFGEPRGHAQEEGRRNSVTSCVFSLIQLFGLLLCVIIKMKALLLCLLKLEKKDNKQIYQRIIDSMKTI